MGEFEDHFNFDVGSDPADTYYLDDEEEDEGAHAKYSYHSKRRHGYDGDESRDHYGYNNSLHRGGSDRHARKNEYYYETPASLRPLLGFDDDMEEDHHHAYMDAKHHEYRREHEYERERDMEERRHFHERPIYAEDHHFDHNYAHEELEWPESREHSHHEELEWPETTSYYHSKDQIKEVHDDHHREHYFNHDREERDWYKQMERSTHHEVYEVPEHHETKSKKSKKAAKNDEHSLDFYSDYDDDGNYDSYKRQSHKVADDSEGDEYPVYPYEGEIHYDASKGYGSYYDPYYDELSHFESHYDHEDYANKAATPAAKKKLSKAKKEHKGVPLRRKADRSPYVPRASRKNGVTDNETPMYVRPYLEDPIFLQPDDEETEMLHPDYAEEHHTATGKQHHDLPGDPDLENPDSDDEEHEPQWIAEHRNTLARTAAMTSNEGSNPNGFLKQGASCNHNFECISGKCLSFLNKAPACMPF